MSVEENKALVRRFLEEQARGNLDVIDELLSPGFVDRGLLPGQGPTREDFKRAVAEILDAFSIISFTIEEQIAEGDTVVTKYKERSVIRGEFGGLPPTGTEENFEGIYVHRISEGKITEEWSQANTLRTTLERLEQEMLERERVEHELRVAKRIQHALLPKDAPELEGWGIAHDYRPAREVGGDFYDFLDLKDGRVVLIMGDFSGSGDGLHPERAPRRRPTSRHPPESGVGGGQRRTLYLPSAKHVRHLLLRRPRTHGGVAAVRERRAQPPVLLARRHSDQTQGEGDAPGPHAGNGLRGEGDDPRAGRWCAPLQ